MFVQDKDKIRKIAINLKHAIFLSSAKQRERMIMLNDDKIAKEAIVIKTFHGLDSQFSLLTFRLPY